MLTNMEDVNLSVLQQYIINITPVVRNFTPVVNRIILIGSKTIMFTYSNVHDSGRDMELEEYTVSISLDNYTKLSREKRIKEVLR